MMTQGKKYSVSIMQTAHLDMKQPTNPYLHYAEQLEKAKKHNQYLLRHKKLINIAHFCKSTNYLFLMLQPDKNLTPGNC